jgi:HTH-type transcriptional repressor of NAD biosynthesis genes
MGHRNHWVEAFIDPEKYDVLLYLSPDVKWVADGQRLNGDQARRERLNHRLLDMYAEFGFADKIMVVSGDYSQRLDTAVKIVDDMLGLKQK